MNLKIASTNRKAICVFLSGILVASELFLGAKGAQTYAKNSNVKTLPETVPITNPIDNSGEFSIAKLDDLNIITVEANLTFPVNTEINEGFIVKENNEIVKIKKITKTVIPGTTSTTIKIELSENVKLDQKLTVSKEGFIEKEVVLGDVFSSLAFEKLFYYEGNDLGNTYSSLKTNFRVWAPTAMEVKLVTYKNWDDKSGYEIIMKKAEKGTWTYELNGDQKGMFYTYKVNIGGIWNEVVDPYARSVAANGDKGAILDLKETNPGVWKPNEKPNFTSINDAIIYELHVRDFSIDKNSGIINKGKFLAFTEKGTKGTDGKLTGIDYIKNLGITHVQLMPISDYASVDETSNSAQFSWGYDVKNFNVPEGSYSTNPFDPVSRVKELKQAVQSLHDSGLRVTMDVVYNAMHSKDDVNLNKLVPGYYFKSLKDVTVNDSKNRIASENVMARKFIVDSVLYWAKEYNLDGFRFDYMGTLDTKTINEIRKKLSSINPSILVIGDGLDVDSNLSSDLRATQTNASKIPEISQFNHIIRDGIAGSVLNVTEKGFVNGKPATEGYIKKGIVGGIDYSGVTKSEPAQSIIYAESHDNNTLWDKILLTNPKDTNEVRLKMHRLANSIILTSQGIPFLQAGQEFLRTKGGNGNSYNSPDSVNMLDWLRKSGNDDTVNYLKGLIELRKAHPAFRMTSADMIKKNLNFLEAPENVVAYEMNYNANMDTWANIVVAFNANTEETVVKLSKKGTWNIVVNGEKAGVSTIKQFKGSSLVVPALSSMVIYYEDKSIFASFPFWIYTFLSLCGITCVILFLKDRKKV